MKRSEWVEEIAKDCQFSEIVEGGSMCKENSKKREYCTFHKCPRIELERKER